jgi:hypothetical protein
MKKNLLYLILTALGTVLSAPVALAQSTPPVLTNTISEIDVTDGGLVIQVTNGGTNYSQENPPTITLTNGGGNYTSVTPTIDDATGEIVSISVAGASGFINQPAVNIVGGTSNTTPAISSSGAEAVAKLTGASYTAPFQDEVWGAFGRSIYIWSVALGTDPAAGFTYDFTVNGLSIGSTAMPFLEGVPDGVIWTPPLPGVYSIVSTTSDGDGNTAVSSAVRYFAVGTAFVSPEAGSSAPFNSGQGFIAPGVLVPVGSSIVLQATSTPEDGFIQEIDFYTDWDASSGTTGIGGASSGAVAGHGTLIANGITKNYPYSVIYSPAGAANTTHLLKAVAWDNNGNPIPMLSSNALDQMNVTMTTANPTAAPPTSLIVSPANSSIIEIPAAGSGSTIQVNVSAGAGVPASGSTGNSATISKVELYINGVLVNTDTAYPYTFNWTPTVTGIYELTALTYDNLGNVVASPTNIVTIDSPITIAITAPASGASLTSGIAATITATVSDTNLTNSGTTATISSVQFYQDGVLLTPTQSSNSGNSYTESFVVNAPLSGSSSVLTAVATDSLGFTGTSQGVTVNVSVTSTSGQSGTSIISPPTESVSVGSSVVIQATSALQKAGHSVEQVDFYTDWTTTGTTGIGGASSGSVKGSGTYLGSSYSAPYSIIYTPAGAAGTVHVVKAVAWDNTGAAIPGIGTSDQVTLTMAAAVAGGETSCVIVTPTTGSLIEIPNYASDSAANVPVIVTAGTGSTSSITKVELYVNGALYGSDTAYPYSFSWTPQVTGVFDLTAIAYDNHGNAIASSSSTVASNVPVPVMITIEASPTVAIISPGNGGTLNSGAAASIQAIASDTNLDKNGKPVSIQQVQFFQDGTFVGVATTPTSGDTYTVSFIPTQKLVNGVVVPSLLTALATDTLGFTGASSAISVNITSGGTGNNVVIGTPPSVTLTAPTDQVSVVVNNPVTLSATADAPNGNVASVAFLVDNAVVTTLTQYPYSTTYTFENIGTYNVIAQVVDNVGDKTSTAAITVNVVPEPPPSVSVTTPMTGGIITAGQSVTVTATASSPSGTIAKVQFYENGILFGTETSPPYTATFTPLSAGVYTLTAIATDNAGETTTSSSSVVDAVAATEGLGTISYFGQYQSLTEGGRFAFMVIDGTYGTFIGHTTSGPNAGAVTFYSDLSVSAAGSFTSGKASSAASTVQLSGTASSTGVSGTLLPNEDLLIGTSTQTNGFTVASGYYTGDLGGQAGSQVTGIVGADGSLMIYISSGKFSDVGDGSVDSTGSFTITTVGNNQLVGKVDPSTGFLTGTLSGASGGTLLAARVSGGTFSDGVLTNISTRGQVGEGADAMIAGFVVGGTSPKQLLVRAAGPALTTFGLSGAVAGTQLQIYSGTALVASNTGWSSTAGNEAAVSQADTAAGAFAYPVGSADSALVGTFAPGSYTAMVTGTGTSTGVALVEIYDLDAYSPFSAKKLVNISTRGNVGSGADVLIGGFNIDGVAPKRLLIRGAGPSLSAFNVSGPLATPFLQLINTATQTVIRENYSWQTGNDSGLVTAAEQSTGAFAFPDGSADSAMLIVLPPGSYTVVLSGAKSATGAALVEIYEVP